MAQSYFRRPHCQRAEAVRENSNIICICCDYEYREYATRCGLVGEIFCSRCCGILENWLTEQEASENY